MVGAPTEHREIRRSVECPTTTTGRSAVQRSPIGPSDSIKRDSPRLITHLLALVRINRRCWVGRFWGERKKFCVVHDLGVAVAVDMSQPNCCAE